MTVELIQLCKQRGRKFIAGAPSLSFIYIFFPDFSNPFHAPATQAKV